MATEKRVNALATEVQQKKDNTYMPRVRIFLPPHEEDGSGIKVDQYEHVTIAGVRDGKDFQDDVLIKRGEYVEVTAPVYMQLRNKFPGI